MLCRVAAGIKPARVKDSNTGRMVEDYWEASKKMLMEFDFLDSLKKYDKDHIPPEIITRIRPYVSDPDFQPDIIQKVRAHGFVFSEGATVAIAIL